MAEYIKREAVIDLITRRYENPEICMQEINSIPAADVVEVVRCRDCKYGTSVWSGSVLCGHPEYNLLEGALAYEADHFCAYGKREG